MDKKQEYSLAFVGLSAVVIAFLSLLYVNDTMALIAAVLAMIAMVMTVAFVYLEDEELSKELEEIVMERRKQKGRKEKSSEE